VSDPVYWGETRALLFVSTEAAKGGKDMKATNGNESRREGGREGGMYQLRLLGPARTPRVVSRKPP